MLPLSLSEITESKQEIAKIFFKKNGFVHFDLRIVLTVYLKMPPTSASQVTRPNYIVYTQLCPKKIVWV